MPPTWHVAYTDPDGDPMTLDGQRGDLRGRPAQPADDPRASRAPTTSQGPSFHSARWDPDIDLAGKDVAMIGAGASGFQIAPAIADTVRSLSVFQRTAQWIAPNPLYYQPVGDGVAWAIEHLPFYDRWYRTLVAYPVTDGAAAATRDRPRLGRRQRVGE